MSEPTPGLRISWQTLHLVYVVTSVICTGATGALYLATIVGVLAGIGGGTALSLAVFATPFCSALWLGWWLIHDEAREGLGSSPGQ